MCSQNVPVDRMVLVVLEADKKPHPGTFFLGLVQCEQDCYQYLVLTTYMVLR